MACVRECLVGGVGGGGGGEKEERKKKGKNLKLSSMEVPYLSITSIQ